MSLLPIAIIADDLTGATDTAAAFARPRQTVAVSLGIEPRSVEGSAAFAINTESRACPPDIARDRVAEAAKAAVRAGAKLIYKKVDSNLRGNIGAEMAALRDVQHRPIVLAPAFPGRGRTTIRGIALVDDIPVAETEMGRDAEAPVTYSQIVSLFSAQQDALRIEHCYLDALRGDSKAIASSLSNCDVLVVDAESDDDLDLIAEAVFALSPPPVLSGSAGLAAATARRLLGKPNCPVWPKGTAGPVFAVLASSSVRLTRQLAALDPSIALVPLPCAKLTSEDDLVPELNQAIASTLAELYSGRDVVVHATGSLPDVPDPVALVVEHLAHLAFVVARHAAPRALLVGGGSTAQAVLATLGTAAIEVDDEPLPGIAGGIAIGGEMDGRPLVLKPGAAGGETAVAELIHYLGRRVAALEAIK